MRANQPLILAVPKGRILKELEPLLSGVGIEPEAAFNDPSARQLQFATNIPELSIIRVRSFDVATFVAFGAAHLGVAGNDVLMEFDYAENYAPVDLKIGACRLSIAEPRDMVESDDPDRWALGVNGLRQSRERPGWLCLESVARAQIPALGADDSRAKWAASTRLLMMGRTKTMDRLFRAADGHSRSIPASAAIAFVHAALASLDDREREVMELRLGVVGGSAATPEQVAETLGSDEDLVRSLESDAWVRIQSPRSYDSVIGGRSAN